MEKVRVIARLDIKNEFVIKGIQLEGLRKIGNPLHMARKYYEDGIDEIIMIDAVASLYGRNNLFSILKQACKEVFIPITIAGGIRTIEDIEKALDAGADKIALNSAAIRNPNFINEASKIYGSQCIIGSIEAKQKLNHYEAYIDNGREETGLDIESWAQELTTRGVGEILITSIDRDGTKKGFDVDLIKKVMGNTSVPVIASGGAGSSNDIVNCITETAVDAIAVGSVLHYQRETVGSIKKELLDMQINVRHE